jgi:hypothetical protein
LRTDILHTSLTNVACEKGYLSHALQIFRCMRLRRRPYRVECTGSLPTSEVKRRRARLVLGWGTAWEHPRVLSAFHLRSILSSAINSARHLQYIRTSCPRHRECSRCVRSLQVLAGDALCVLASVSSVRQRSLTVAILAQGTSQADAETQAFLSPVQLWLCPLRATFPFHF